MPGDPLGIMRTRVASQGPGLILDRSCRGAHLHAQHAIMRCVGCINTARCTENVGKAVRYNQRALVRPPHHRDGVQDVVDNYEKWCSGARVLW